MDSRPNEFRRDPIRRIALLFAAAVAFVAAAEFTARAQDWLLEGTPLLSTPTEDANLFVNTTNGRRGRPHGQFGKWKLNSFGFRSPEIASVPPPGTIRVVTLGASETFGLYESPDHEYPAELQRLLHGSPRSEVVNVALPGLTLYSAREYYQTWVAQFHPAVVVIYPSPVFYLNEVAPGERRSIGNARANETPLGIRDRLARAIGSSRLLGRVHSFLHVPAPIQRWRDAKAVDGVLRQRPDDWVFRQTPQDRLEQYVRDLHALVAAVRESGATVILATHATRVSDPPNEDDLHYLLNARVNFPRATSEVIARFEVAANEVIRRYAASEQICLVDAAADMDGKKDLFADIVHFTDKGSERMARNITNGLRGELRRMDHASLDHAF